MKSMCKSFVSLFIASLLLFQSSIIVFAAYDNENMNVMRAMEDLLEENGLNAAIEILTSEESQTFWIEHISSFDVVTNFENQLQGFEYEKNKDPWVTAMVITDQHDERNKIAYVTTAYENSNGESVYSMFIYNMSNNQLLRILSRKVDINKTASVFYEYETSYCVFQKRSTQHLLYAAWEVQLPAVLFPQC